MLIRLELRSSYIFSFCIQWKVPAVVVKHFYGESTTVGRRTEERKEEEEEKKKDI